MLFIAPPIECSSLSEAIWTLPRTLQDIKQNELRDRMAGAEAKS